VTLVLATANAGKVRELRTLLADLDIPLRTLADFPGAPSVAETAPTYLGNARAKAHAVASFCGLPALADDSGLEVDALGGAPGVRSARFAADALGETGDRANTALLLRRLEGVADARRTARFRCVVVVARADGAELTADGLCEGRIARAPSGDAGFGYDPVFVYPPLGRTFAELTSDEKDRVSHRARAIAQLKDSLSAFVANGAPAPPRRRRSGALHQ
jgi:XTP/dITP diphosphohydrolase